METTNNENSLFFTGNKNKWVLPRGYYMHSYNNFDMTIHSHERIEIMYVSTGEFQIEYQRKNGEYEKTTILPSNYVFIDANVPHKIRVNNIATVIYNIELSIAEQEDFNFTINNVCKNESYVNSFFSTPKEVFVCADNGLFLQNLLIIQKFIGNDINNLKIKDTYLNYQLASILLLLAKQYTQTKKHVSGITYVNTAVNYIYENYNRDISLTDLAEVCKISPNYLNVLFSKTFGCTVKDYINKYRITRATLLLTGTNMPVDEIRAQVGYHNKISFHQNFLKHVGTSPKKYRQEERTSNIQKSHTESSQTYYWNN